MASLAHPERF
jgi:hypothetical protein